MGPRCGGRVFQAPPVSPECIGGGVLGWGESWDGMRGLTIMVTTLPVPDSAAPWAVPTGDG